MPKRLAEPPPKPARPRPGTTLDGTWDRSIQRVRSLPTGSSISTATSRTARGARSTRRLSARSIFRRPVRAADTVHSRSGDPPVPAGRIRAAVPTGWPRRATRRKSQPCGRPWAPRGRRSLLHPLVAADRNPAALFLNRSRLFAEAETALPPAGAISAMREGTAQKLSATRYFRARPVSLRSSFRWALCSTSPNSTRRSSRRSSPAPFACWSATSLRNAPTARAPEPWPRSATACSRSRTAISSHPPRRRSRKPCPSWRRASTPCSPKSRASIEMRMRSACTTGDVASEPSHFRSEADKLLSEAIGRARQCCSSISTD